MDLDPPRRPAHNSSDSSDNAPPSVLMVTGAFYPELSGAGLQCRTLIAALGPRAQVTVLTTMTDPSLPTRDVVDGIPVHRIFVDPRRKTSLLAASARLVVFWLRHGRKVDLVHLHGFSKKTMLIVLLAKLASKPIVLKLTSIGHDDPEAAARWGPLARWSYRRADRLVGVSPRFLELSRRAGLPEASATLIPNGVDPARFRPPGPSERRALRAALGLPSDLPLILFVGFFSREKHPDLLLEAWLLAQKRNPPESAVVFVGATRSRYHEVDPSIAGRLVAEAARSGLSARLHFIERAEEIERYFRCTDIFALPSSREGMPNALLEAMSSGLPCVASRLPGVTDWMIEDGVSGLLVPPDDADAWGDALHRLLSDPGLRTKLGMEARRRVSAQFTITRTSTSTAALYREILGAEGAEGGAAPGRHKAAVTAAFDARADSWQRQYDSPGDFRSYCLNVRRRDVLALLEAGRCGPRVMDVGCGTGDYLKPLLERGHSVTAIDISPSMAERVRQRFSEVSAELLEVSVGDVETASYGDASFDGIVCAGVLEYLPSPENGLKQIHRMLAPNGVAVITVPNACSPFVWVDRAHYAVVRAVGAALDCIGLFAPLRGRPRTQAVFRHRARRPSIFLRELEKIGFEVEDLRFGWFGSFALNDSIPGAALFSVFWERFSRHPVLGRLGMCCTVRARKR